MNCIFIGLLPLKYLKSVFSHMELFTVLFFVTLEPVALSTSVLVV